MGSGIADLEASTTSTPPSNSKAQNMMGEDAGYVQLPFSSWLAVAVTSAGLTCVLAWQTAKTRYP